MFTHNSRKCRGDMMIRVRISTPNFKTSSTSSRRATINQLKNGPLLPLSWSTRNRPLPSNFWVLRNTKTTNCIMNYRASYLNQSPKTVLSDYSHYPAIYWVSDPRQMSSSVCINPMRKVLRKAKGFSYTWFITCSTGPSSLNRTFWFHLKARISAM